MKKYIEKIKKCPLFEGIDESSLSSLFGCLRARVVEFDKRYTIFSEGSRAGLIGILLSGRAQMERTDLYGNRSILSEFTPPSLFAEAFACAELAEIPVDIIATEPSEVMLIEASHVLHTCTTACPHHQRLIYNLMKDIATKNLALHRKIEATSKRTTREKLLSYLTVTAKSLGRTSFDIPFDRQGLADYLEVDRSGLSVEISKLQREGVIRANKNHFEIL